MKKISSVFMCSFLIIPVLLSYAGEGPDLDRNFLARQNFKYGTVISNGGIMFNANGTYSIEYSSEGIVWYDEGIYSIIKSRVFLKPGKCFSNKGGQAIDCSRSMGAATCTVENAGNDLYFNRYFVCTSKNNKDALSTNMPAMSCPIESSRVASGAGRTFKGVPVVTMGNVSGITTASVKIREKPSVNAKALEYIKELFSPDQVRQSVPEKTELVVVARTRDRDRVQSWNNYWYLVNVGVMTEVWMFGEFVKIR